jgi:hypothetical protein
MSDAHLGSAIGVGVVADMANDMSAATGRAIGGFISEIQAARYAAQVEEHNKKLRHDKVREALGKVGKYGFLLQLIQSAHPGYGKFTEELLQLMNDELAGIELYAKGLKPEPLFPSYAELCDYGMDRAKQCEARGLSFVQRGQHEHELLQAKEEAYRTSKEYYLAQQATWTSESREREAALKAQLSEKDQKCRLLEAKLAERDQQCLALEFRRGTSLINQAMLYNYLLGTLTPAQENVFQQKSLPILSEWAAGAVAATKEIQGPDQVAAVRAPYTQKAFELGRHDVHEPEAKQLEFIQSELAAATAEKTAVSLQLASAVKTLREALRKASPNHPALRSVPLFEVGLSGDVCVRPQRPVLTLVDGVYAANEAVMDGERALLIESDLDVSDADHAPLDELEPGSAPQSEPDRDGAESSDAQPG